MTLLILHKNKRKLTNSKWQITGPELGINKMSGPGLEIMKMSGPGLGTMIVLEPG